MKGHNLQAHTWLGILVVLALVVAHVALFGFAFRNHPSVALVTVMLGLVGFKFIWWKVRR